MFGGALPGMVRKHARFAERVELGVCSNQFAYRGSRIRLRQAKGDLANDLVALVPPGARIAALGHQSQHPKHNVPHGNLSEMKTIIAAFRDCTVNCFTIGRVFCAAGRPYTGLQGWRLREVCHWPASSVTSDLRISRGRRLLFHLEIGGGAETVGYWAPCYQEID
jgi:hypothetical protein